MDDIRASKLLSLVLRHDPGRIGIELDASGWVAVPVLLSALDAHGSTLSRSTRPATGSARTRGTVSTSTSAWPDRHRRPRSTTARRPATSTASCAPGWIAVPVTQCTSRRTSRRRGGWARRGDHVVLVVDAAAMHADGHAFSVSDNGVWLVGSVPARYLTVMT